MLRQLRQMRKLRQLRIVISEYAGYFFWVGACGYWLFLRRLVISDRSSLVDVGIDWGGLCCSLSEKFYFGALTALWEACWDLL